MEEQDDFPFPGYFSEGSSCSEKNESSQESCSSDLKSYYDTSDGDNQSDSTDSKTILVELSSDTDAEDCKPEITDHQGHILGIFSGLTENVYASAASEFECPPRYSYYFPGDKKRKGRRQVTVKCSDKCHICNKDSTKQEMACCDYCDKKFHLDCPDPPLTYVSTRYWMCPYHLESLVESVLYKDSLPSPAERKRIWDLCREPIDHDQVLYEFLSNLNRNNHGDEHSLGNSSGVTGKPAPQPSPPDVLMSESNVAVANPWTDCSQSMESSETVNQDPLPTDVYQDAGALQNVDKTYLASIEEQNLWLSVVQEFQNESVLPIFISFIIQEMSRLSLEDSE